MKLPLYLVIPSCLLTVVLTWWLSIQRYDFVTPPSAEALYAKKQLLEVQGQEFQSDKYAPQPPPERQAPPTIAYEPPSPTRFDIGAVDTAPGLNEYTARAQSGHSGLLQLAKTLEERGYPERALLAWERVLDTVAAPPAVHREAIQAASRLRTELSPWVVDPAETQTLHIQVGATLNDPALLKKSLENLAQTLNQASSGILIIEPKLSLAPQTQPSPVFPIAVSIALNGNNKASTHIVTFKPSPDPAAMSRSLDSICYDLIRSTLKEAGGFQNLPPLNLDQNPSEVLRSRITRLQWRAFASALTRKAEG